MSVDHTGSTFIPAAAVAANSNKELAAAERRRRFQRRPRVFQVRKKERKGRGVDLGMGIYLPFTTSTESTIHSQKCGLLKVDAKFVSHFSKFKFSLKIEC